MEEDPVADDMAVGGRRYILLGPVDREVRRAVDGRVGDQLQCVRALNEQIHHMVGLVEQDGRLAPGTLLAPPVGELGRHDRVDVRADLRASQELDDVAAAIEDFLEVTCAHGYLPSARLDPGRC